MTTLPEPDLLARAGSLPRFLYIYGFALQEATLPLGDTSQETAEAAEMMMAQVPADEYPHMTEFTIGHVLQPDCDCGEEFAFGLGLILDGLERARDSS